MIWLFSHLPAVATPALSLIGTWIPTYVEEVGNLSSSAAGSRRLEVPPLLPECHLHNRLLAMITYIDDHQQFFLSNITLPIQPPTMATTVDAKLLKSTKFPPEFNQKVDMQKVNLEVMKKSVLRDVREHKTS